MKSIKIIGTLAVLLASHATVAAQVSPFVSAQIDAAARPCADIAGATAGLPEAQAKTVATAALPTCYQALQTLDTFEKTNGAGLSPDERNYFYYIGGNVIWMTAASEAIKNDGQVNMAICSQVKAAEAAWSNVNVPSGSEVGIEIQTNVLRQMLVPACNAAR